MAIAMKDCHDKIVLMASHPVKDESTAAKQDGVDWVKLELPLEGACLNRTAMTRSLLSVNSVALVA